MLSLQSPDSVAIALGLRVRALRLAHNFSQQDLARMTACSLSSVRRLEASGQGTLVLVIRVAQALHAEQGLEGLFVKSGQSIAALEQSTQAAQRVRARKPSIHKAKAAGAAA